MSDFARLAGRLRIEAAWHERAGMVEEGRALRRRAAAVSPAPELHAEPPIRYGDSFTWCPFTDEEIAAQKEAERRRRDEDIERCLRRWLGLER